MSGTKSVFHSDDTAEEGRRSDRRAREQGCHLCPVMDTDTNARYAVIGIPEGYRYVAQTQHLPV